MFWSIICFFQPFYNCTISAVTVIEGLADTANGGSRSSGNPIDFGITFSFAQFYRNIKTLGNGLNFLNSADIIKETFTFFNGL
jgi:hypothetical protein